MSNDHWRPVADMQGLRARAQLLQKIRAFFEAKDVLEVETPLLSRHSNPDPQLSSIRAQYPSSNPQSMYLQTSPEFAMKRLLANGSGPVFQICKAFRSGERGSRHNPEFSMLEWYRPGFDEQALMQEVKTLIQSVLPLQNWQMLSYEELFRTHLAANPHNTSTEELAELAAHHIESDIQGENMTKDNWLDLLFSQVIEPKLVDPVFIYDYPATQAALAQLKKNNEGTLMARRFELVIKGMEIANGYRELTDPQEQRQRFMQDLQNSKDEQGSLDENLLSALEHGLPECAGVAIGLDRLLMLICNASSINEVLSFPFDRA